MILKAIQGHQLLSVVYTNNVYALHRFWDITTLTVYVTTYDLEKSFIFDKTVELTSHVRFSFV